VDVFGGYSRRLFGSRDLHPGDAAIFTPATPRGQRSAPRQRVSPARCRSWHF
jgi:hypothetical protein